MNHLRVSDIFAASVPTVTSVAFRTVASLTLSDWKDIASIAGAVLGAVYLVWKWRREARRPQS